MFIGRVAWGCATYILYYILGNRLTWKIFLTQAFINSILGINNSINDDVFVNAKSMSNDLHQVYLSDEILNMNGGEMRVVDIAGLTEQLQCLVFGDIIRSVYALKHGDYFFNHREVEQYLSPLYRARIVSKYELSWDEIVRRSKNGNESR